MRLVKFNGTLFYVLIISYIKEYYFLVTYILKVKITYKLPANPAALFSMTVGSGGLHIIINSWSDCITTPGNWGNHTLTCTKPYNKNKCQITYVTKVKIQFCRMPKKLLLHKRLLA